MIGFLSNYLFERTGFPDMLLLIILGLLLGPISGLVAPGSVMDLAPYLAALALVFILFDGGMAMNIYRVFSESPRATILALVGFAMSVFATTLFMSFIVIPDVPVLYSVLFGTIFGGSSSIAIISLASRIKVSEKCSTILSLESAITDILCIVFSLVVIEIILKGASVDLMAIGQSIASRFSTGVVLGVIFGIIWLSILKRIAQASYAWDGVTFTGTDKQSVSRLGPRVGSFLLQAMNEIVSSPDDQQTARCVVAGLLSHCQEQLANRAKILTRSGALFEVIKKYIEENASLPLTRENVAKRFHITPNYLSHLFRKSGDKIGRASCRERV